MSWLSARAVRRHRFSTRHARPRLLELEPRVNPTNVLQYHMDTLSTGVNNTETVLTRSNVNETQFGKLWQVQVAGQVYAEPLVLQGVNITVGAHQGLHDVVFVATEHDQLYAIDANAVTPTILWQRSFLSPATGDAAGTIYNTSDFLAGSTVTSVDTSLGVTSIVKSADLTPEIGITGTPVIDAANGTIYLITKATETVGGTAHYLQRLYAVNIQTGTDRTAPYLLGDTTFNGTTYVNYASETADPNKATNQIYVHGSGDGSVANPYGGTGNVVQFNALREHQRPALNLANGVVYMGWASHGDNGPYHGWMVGISAYSAGTPTMTLKGVLNTTPNGGLGGIWQAGGALTFDGTYFYFETGNGTFDGDNGSSTSSNPTAPAPHPPTGLNNAGFPINGDYSDSFVKVALDPTTTATNQNITTGVATETANSNGWGLKIVDYFTPFNQGYLNVTDKDVGSSAAVVVPDYNPTIGGTNQFASASNPRLLVGSGKEGVIYLINRDNMGKYGVSNNIVQNTANQLSGSLDSAALFNGRMYYVPGYNSSGAKTFTFANGLFSSTPDSTSTDTFAFAGSTPFISANGLTNGIVWDVDRGFNQLRAYSSDSYATELWNSDQAPNGRDALGAAVKFQVATQANGRVYVGAGTTSDFLVVYGELPPQTAPPSAPASLTAQTASNTQINLSWVDTSTSPNFDDSFYIEQSPNGSTNWTQIAITNATSYAVTGLTANTTYYFRLRSHDSLGFSGYAGPISGTTNASATHSIDYSAGFTSATNLVLAGTQNGTNSPPTISNGALHMTTALASEAKIAYYNVRQNIVNFTSTFKYTKNGAADGLTFVIQNDSRGTAAIGGAGGSLAYAGITPSVAVAINIYNGNSLGTEFLTNGTVDNNFSETNINTTSNTPITVSLSYANGLFTASFTQGTNVDTKTMSLNIPALLGTTTAWVGFTAATGGANATQDINNWTFDQGIPPAAPTSLQATVTGYTGASTQSAPLGAHLTWIGASGAASYTIQRKLTAGGAYATVGTSTTTSFDDTGLVTGSNYFYQVIATNTVGSGSPSAPVSITTPTLPPTATNSQLNTVTPTSISFQWQDNANNEDGYQILRQIGSNGFVLLATLPPDTNPAPSTMTFTDTGLTPGTHYDYHIQSYNLAGYSDFAGVSTTTVTIAPSNLAASAANGAIGLTWTAVSGATSYNVYRGTSASGEGATPIATGLTNPTYTDSSLAYNTTYYYQVTATDAGGESAKSNEASAFFAAPPTIASIQINDGSAQRSELRSLTITFSGPVTFGGGGALAAFQLLHVQTGVNVAMTASVFPDAQGRTVVILTFLASGTEIDPLSADNGNTASPSLADGRYQLTINGSLVTGSAGLALDGAGTGTPGSNYVSPTDTLGGGTGQLKLFRIFGDTNGDGAVDQVDLGQFRSTFNAGSSDPLYISFLDANNDGNVDQVDLGQFRARFNGNVF